VEAVGIETEEQDQWIRALGCDSRQGYYFAPPMRFESLTTLLDHLLDGPKPSLPVQSSGSAEKPWRIKTDR
jgi:predicted signal transduction protein with EAL and GGDEF domain